MSSTSDALASPPVTAGAGWSKDARVIALVATAHFVSHFHLMLLPPIFGPVREAFGVDYIQIGLALTAYNVISAALQTPAGFLVDRIGPRVMLTCGLLISAGALLVAALLPVYWLFLVAYGFLGLANTVYHPADYSILSSAIDDKRIGKAFSIHTFAGYLGSGLAPALVLGCAAIWGWQGAFVFAALNIATGEVVHDLKPCHAGTDVLAFFKWLDTNVPADLDVHVVLDNLSAHSAEPVRKWLALPAQKRWHLDFTPTTSSG